MTPAVLERLADLARRRRPGDSLPRGLALVGTVWPGGMAEPFDGAVIVNSAGKVVHLGPVPARLPHVVLGGSGCWIGPGIVDAHVHLGSTDPADAARRGVLGLRDLGCSVEDAKRWRTGFRRPSGGLPFVAVSGPVLTAPGGYPGPVWGVDSAVSVPSAAAARHVVHGVATSGADVVKIALESGNGEFQAPSPRVVRAVVEAAHDAGLAVVAHALTVEMVRRAVGAGVDELAHTPTERLPDDLVEEIADARIAVTSTLQRFFATGVGRDAAANAADLLDAGVVLRYGTDHGRPGTVPGADPRELDRLAAAGLGRLGALRAATEVSGRAHGMRRRTGHIRLAEPAALVLLPDDPLAEPGAWRAPLAVLADGHLHLS